MTAEDSQRDYYNDTAEVYANMHVQAGDEHFIALEYILGLAHVARAESILDVGSGTGRGAHFLAQRRPDLRVVGIEPSDGLRAQAAAGGGEFVDGTGEAIPFDDDAFDLVISLGVLHHVPDPRPVVEEMLRVARRGVLISDSNRFGQGRPAARALKAIAYKAGLWPQFERFRTRGKGYMESAGDGIFYSYSIYDSVPQLAAWADRVFIIPTMAVPKGWTPPLFVSPHGLLVAVKEDMPGWAGCP